MARLLTGCQGGQGFLRPPPAVHREPAAPLGGRPRNGPERRLSRASQAHTREVEMANEEALPTVRGSGAGGGGVRLRHRAPGTRLASGCASRVLYIFLLQRRRLVKGKDVRGGGGSGRRVSRDLWGTLARSVAPVLPPPGLAREVGGNLREKGREGASLGTSGKDMGTLGAGRPSCEGSWGHSTAPCLLPLSPRGVTCARRELTIGDISQRTPKDQASIDGLRTSTGQSARGSGSEGCRGP